MKNNVTRACNFCDEFCKVGLYNTNMYHGRLVRCTFCDKITAFNTFLLYKHSCRRCKMFIIFTQHAYVV